jgi:hypothetical protein
MRIVVSALGLAAVLLIAHSFRAAPANAQVAADFYPFTAGQTVVLSVDLPDGTRQCRVTGVVNGFIGCARDEQRRHSDQWINLRNVQTITRPER